ncbi:MAG: serine/threonine-protein kinase M1 [Claussenomyces sp. TS43310]|nr:MAG: serine/threonine-protein kinase M1 [Claussenomyces sp. TS43310]
MAINASLRVLELVREENIYDGITGIVPLIHSHVAERTRMKDHFKEVHKSFEPPPSTLAANLVNNLPAKRNPARSEEQEDFQHLLLEVSESREVESGDDDVEAKLEQHHKLIYVVTKAVLELPIKKNPFTNVQQQLQQASEALDILIATIKETPEVLLHVTGPQARIRRGSRFPLWIWLSPRLLALLGREGCGALQDKIQEFFEISFTAASRSVHLWALNTSLFNYLRLCADGALNYLQDASSSVHAPSSFISITLPPVNIDEHISLPKTADLYLEGCTYTLEGKAIISKHISLLLSFLLDACSSTAFIYDATPAFRVYLAWIIDSFILLREFGTVRTQDPANQESHTDMIRPIRALHNLFLASGESINSTARKKGYRALADFCTELVEHQGSTPDDSIWEVVNECLQELILFSYSDGFVHKLLNLRLLPKLLEWTSLLKDSTSRREDVYAWFKQLHGSSHSASQAYENGRQLAQQPQSLMRSVNVEVYGDRPMKRLKLATEDNLLSELVANTYLLLGSQEASDLDGLSQVAASCFLSLSNSDRSNALELLGHISCAAAGSLSVTRDENGAIVHTRCDVCDSPHLHNELLADKNDANLASEAIRTLTNLIALPKFEQSARPRILAMLTLGKYARHFHDIDFLNLETSVLGQYCLKSLRSSVRELRIAAGRTLPAFFSSNADTVVIASNRRNILELLREISEQSPLHLTETCILAWGQIGRVSRDQELNLVLIRLVEYLGHTNQIASSVAFNEILMLAETLNMPVGQLFAPFWRSVAPTAIKDLQSRPQKTQLLADLLSISVSELLIKTQSYTLPWLISAKKLDVVLRIAQARGDADPWIACLANSNLAPTLAFLLVQNVPDMESFVMDLMRNVSSYFNESDLMDLLRIEPIGTTVELLSNAGEEDVSKKSRVRHALQYLASSTVSSSSDSRNSKRGNQLGPFFDVYTLGIMSGFSDLLNDLRGWQPAAEKCRALKGIEEMLQIGKSHTRSALPQICACLQSALANDNIRTEAFAAWSTMMRCLDDEDIGGLLENTFSMIILRWKDFNEASKEEAAQLIEHLLTKKRNLLRDFIDVLPPLGQVEELERYNKRFESLRADIDVRHQYDTFSRRIGHEHASVVTQALNELASYLRKEQAFLQASAISEQPDTVISDLLRSILDACVRFNESNVEIARLSAECIGLIGCLDSNRVEAVRERREIVVVSNFAEAGDTTDFVLFTLEEVLVRAFLSATNPRAQGFLSYAMQELLEKCDFKAVCSIRRKPGDYSDTNQVYNKWLALPEGVRATLTPFLGSSYVLTEMVKSKTTYPIYQPEMKYSLWLRAFVLDLLEQPHNPNAMLIFAPLCRVIRIQDTSVADFLLPFVVLHAVILGSDQQRKDISHEVLKVLAHEAKNDSHSELANLKLCSESIFRVLDYLSRWVQEKQSRLTLDRQLEQKSHRMLLDNDNISTDPGIQRVNELLSSIPAEIISRRAVECKSYARALFHWEQYIRQVRESTLSSAETTPLLERLQEIYTQIDEPDGIEGISAHLHVLDIDQQILGHRKAGRWTAAQSWYEIKLAEQPHDVDVQVNLLNCLKESGQHDVLLNYLEGMQKSAPASSRLLPFATEAAWSTGRWDALQKHLSSIPTEIGGDFNVNVGRILLALHNKDNEAFSSTIENIREQIATSLTVDTTSSLGVCHDAMLKLHVLTELDMIAGQKGITIERQAVLDSLDRRLEVIGAYLNDKQYLLGIRRAVMQLSSSTFTKGDIATAWLTSARLARKGNAIHQSFNAVLHASQLGDESAMIEHARLLWKEGHHRKAIQSLQGAIDSNAFISHNRGGEADPISFATEVTTEQQNLLNARAHLLLAKWLDNAGQTHAYALRSQYQLAARMHQTWERGHYYLGRHYNKLLESEKALAPEHQSQSYLIGETAKLVCENYLRSLNYGTKYVYQTLPRILTLWLDLGIQVNQPMDAKYGTKEFVQKLASYRKDQLVALHTRFNKYIQKMPAYIFYTALPQIVARITHPNNDVYKYLQQIIVKVVSAHPQQALWTLLAVSTSNQSDRRQRGASILQTLRAMPRKAESGNVDLRMMIKSGERLADQLLLCCNAGEFHGNRTLTASITRDLGFNHKICTPSPLAVPIDAALTATLPTLTDSVRTHKAFSRDVITISSFLDEVLVLSSLQKPRKLIARGSDGRSYGLLCKPKDDLRKDQRLMEFNSMINRSLKRDAESSKRRLYIKTYAVTPLNEECGIIEWVNGLKTLREILLKLYKARSITPNFGEIKMYLDEAMKGDEKLPFFTQKVLDQFPPIFHLWFVQMFPDSSAWFNARLKYTRSCAVMSMVGTILGLGDRHGENILFEEGNGGTFHVDFNCLFDKGLTFAQPERVPFRLTHNMVDAMGVYGYEGPFRTSSELTLRLLRQHEETLMTILEAFVYDPTLDLLAKKNKAKTREREGGGVGAGAGAPADTAQGVLDAIRRKVRGLLAGESVPLGVEGQVDELIKQAVSPRNLAAMYIGWCAFF